MRLKRSGRGWPASDALWAAGGRRLRLWRPCIPWAPGHGKAVVVAYFLDGKKRGWVDGNRRRYLGMSITHTVAAAGGSRPFLALIGLFSPLAAQGRGEAGRAGVVWA